MSGVISNTAPLSGPLLLGYLFNWGLFGVLSVQVYYYHLAFSRDHRWTKITVAGVYILELAQTILVTHDAFDTYAIHFGDISALDNVGLLPLSVPIFSGLVSCVVQLHYGNMLRVLSGSRLLGLAVASLSILQCIAAIVMGAQIFHINELSALSMKFSPSPTVWLVGSAACDLIIAFGMTFILLRKDTKLPATHALITKLVRIIVETGCLTAVTATVQLILSICIRDKPYFLCLALALAKVYSNSLLAILNSRIRIEGVHPGSVAQMGPGSGISFAGQNTIERRLELPYASNGTMGRIVDNTVPHIVDVRVCRCRETWPVSDDKDMIPMSDMNSVNLDSESISSKA
ncbi:hypothetical protein SCHPADRAFT_905326 [Schizopora paradoxa]|uniref:DUF6534 domain-containing protein n=1 Tax=Schizopora paradoxa TaxID=27342 RepID=A0A0H2S5J9_9AGAM|nr:hypothetical protein SCHPADRAFT_905326 [Schizopora paradoxa]